MRRSFVGGYLPPTARLRPGDSVTMVNLSATGALFESGLRLRPGSRCELQLGGRDRLVTVIARVTRCFVARLEPTVVRYRTALVFERPIVPPTEQQLLAEYQIPSRFPGNSRDGVAASRPGAGGRLLSVQRLPTTHE
jgi:PilZ domain